MKPIPDLTISTAFRFMQMEVYLHHHALGRVVLTKGAGMTPFLHYGGTCPNQKGQAKYYSSN